MYIYVVCIVYTYMHRTDNAPIMTEIGTSTFADAKSGCGSVLLKCMETLEQLIFLHIVQFYSRPLFNSLDIRIHFAQLSENFVSALVLRR